jgi:FkbM family methyltransferase
MRAISLRRIAPGVKELLERLSSVEKREFHRLRRLPRRVHTQTRFLDHEINLVDACTFLIGVEEIFEKGLYDFDTATESPVIIDCGANIGLSVIRFKQCHPTARVIAFEPDPVIFEALRANIESFRLGGVELHNKAVWHLAGAVPFHGEGGASGRLPKAGDIGPVVTVEAVRLRDYLDGRIDLLKVDIEGAETAVFRDCADRLDSVERLFVEYHSHKNERQDLHELLEILQRGGFRYHLKEAHTAAEPFKARPTLLGMDLQLNVFGVRD